MYLISGKKCILSSLFLSASLSFSQWIFAPRAEEIFISQRYDCFLYSSNLITFFAAVDDITEFIWSQEEPENMGPWAFIQPRFAKQLGYQASHSRMCSYLYYAIDCNDFVFISVQLSLVSRVPYAASAVGVAKIHQQEAKQLLLDSFSGL